MSFADKIIKSRNHLLRLVTGKNGAEEAWCYLRIRPDMYEKYKMDVKTDLIDLTKYGEILFSGWGKEPPEDIKKRIEDEF